MIEEVRAINIEASQFVVNFSKTFDSIHREKREQIQLAYGLSNETVTVIMMLYKNTKAIVCSLDGDTNFFDIVIDIH